MYDRVCLACAAMSFPATGVESAYRNNLKDVAKMLKTKHEDNYMVCLALLPDNSKVKDSLSLSLSLSLSSGLQPV